MGHQNIIMISQIPSSYLYAFHYLLSLTVYDQNWIILWSEKRMNHFCIGYGCLYSTVTIVSQVNVICELLHWSRTNSCYIIVHNNIVLQGKCSIYIYIYIYIFKYMNMYYDRNRVINLKFVSRIFQFKIMFRQPWKYP